MDEQEKAPFGRSVLPGMLNYVKLYREYINLRLARATREGLIQNREERKEEKKDDA